jgi:hypothetical protein
LTVSWSWKDVIAPVCLSAPGEGFAHKSLPLVISYDITAIVDAYGSIEIVDAWKSQHGEPPKRVSNEPRLMRQKILYIRIADSNDVSAVVDFGRAAGKERPTRLRILQGESPCAVNYL